MEIFGFWGLFGKDFVYPRLKKKKNLPNFFSFTFGVCFNQEIFIFVHWWVDSFFFPKRKANYPLHNLPERLSFPYCFEIPCLSYVKLSHICNHIWLLYFVPLISLWTCRFLGSCNANPPYNYSFSLLGVGRYSSWWLSDSTILVIKKTQNLQGNLKRTETSVSDLSI